MIKALLFDLDDTLYDESDYVRSGFAAIARILARESSRNKNEIEGFLHGELARRGRGRIFDAALDWLGLEASRERVQSLVDSYRRHSPAISLDPADRAVLGRLGERFALALVTDGLPLMQSKKVAALGLEGLVDPIVYCWEIGAPKPDPGGYREALRRLGLTSQEALVIGDNPGHDLAAAARLGSRAIRVRRGRFVAEPNPPGTSALFEVNRVAEMDTGRILAALDSSWDGGAK